MNKNQLKYLIDALLFICLIGLAGVGFLQGLVLAEGPVEDVSRKYFMGLHTHQWGHIHFYISIAFTILIIIHLILSWSWIKATSKKIFKSKWGAALAGMVIVSLLIPLIFWAFSLKHADKYAEFGTGSGRGRNLVLSERQVSKESLRPQEKSEPKVTQKETQEAPEVEQEVPKVEVVELPIRKKESAQRKESAEKGESLYRGRQEQEEEPRLIRGRLDEHDTGILITGQTTLLELEKSTGIPKSAILREMGLPTHIPNSENLGRLKRRYNFTMQELRDKIGELLSKKIK
ncbi:MAG: DUF4405 domain-containing protein [Acidobacteriota bacterium]